MVTGLGEFVIRPLSRRLAGVRETVRPSTDEYLARLETQITAIEQALRARGIMPTPPQAAEARDERGADTNRPYSRYAPHMPVATSCLACGRAHLAAVAAALKSAGRPRVLPPELVRIRNVLTDVAASLKEATRFARADGMHHPEVRARVSSAQEAVVLLERLDLSPEALEKAGPQARQEIEALLPRLREARQAAENAGDSLEALTEAAARTGSLARELWGDVALAFAAEELSALWQFDWTPAKVAASPPDHRRKVEAASVWVRRAHEALLAGQPAQEILPAVAAARRALQ